MPHILIVEDEAAIADTLIFALQSEGFTTTWLSLAEQALAEQQRNPADLLILDIGLPDISGFDACKRLRRFSEVPVIFLTARSEEIDRVVGLEIGADDYVTKPFSPRELVARIRVILRRMAPPEARPHPPASATPTSATRCAAGLELRALEARILYLGRALDLTRYEYLLLKTLIEHPGHVLSRAQLMDRVWSDAPDTLDRTVDAHVRSLRAKLRAVAPEHDPIQTHRGLGYSLALA